MLVPGGCKQLCVIITGAACREQSVQAGRSVDNSAIAGARPTLLPIRARSPHRATPITATAAPPDAAPAKLQPPRRGGEATAATIAAIHPHAKGGPQHRPCPQPVVDSPAPYCRRPRHRRRGQDQRRGG